MKIQIESVIFAIALALHFSTSADAELFRQVADGHPAEPITQEQADELGDPFFNLVLRNHSEVTNLGEIEDLLQPNRDQRHVFVVDEHIADASRGGARRAVLSYSGTNQGEFLSPNVMLSVFFDSEDFPDDLRSIEAWGWDNAMGRYNYYRMDSSGTGQLTWKFRGSSVRAADLSPNARAGSCMACHVNGAPIMKELFFPWNNWHSTASKAAYLLKESEENARWPVATSRRLEGHLSGAEDLEVGGILPSITQFNVRRLEAAIRHDDSGLPKLDDDGMAEVINGGEMLRHLFLTTEYNIISSRTKSGLHSFSAGPQAGPTSDVVIPETFFLNFNLIFGGGSARLIGLGVSNAVAFKQLVRLTPAEYKNLVDSSGVKLGDQPGDADFAWLVPEPSHMDNDMVDRLLRKGVVTPEFVAAVQCIDLERPVLSEKRASLLRFVPNEFRFSPAGSDASSSTNRMHPDDLTVKTIAAIEQTNPSNDSTEFEFMALLKGDNPVEELRRRIVEYKDRLMNQLSDDAQRPTELSRLYSLAVSSRRAVLDDEVLQAINETGDKLFPVP